MVTTKKNSKSPKAKTEKGKVDGSKSGEASSPKKPEPKKVEIREVLYPTIDVQLAIGPDAITAAKAKELLGWRVGSENVKLKKDHIFVRDMNGESVYMENNVINRPIYLGNVTTIKQDILQHRWQLNGETIIVGKTGQILNGQHTLIALVFACQEYEKNPGKWSHAWESEPTIEKLVVFGIDESDAVVDTIDTPKPRSLMDVVFRSSFYGNVRRKDRAVLSAMLQHAVKFVWRRTGANTDVFRPKMTHSEGIDFIERHPRILQSITHIFEENGSTNSLKDLLTPGYCAALHYLMAASATDEDNAYWTTTNPSEELIDFSRWDKANDFWVLLAAGDPNLVAVRQAIAAGESDDYIQSTPLSKMSIIIKAWSQWIAGKVPTPKTLALDYVTNDDGVPVLSEIPDLGGIDLGEPS